MILKFVTHSSKVISIARRHGWLPAARYTNLRDIRHFERIGFIDVNWSNYHFERHLAAVKLTQPLMTVAKDIDDVRELDVILDQAWKLKLHCKYVVIVPKDPKLADRLDVLIPSEFVLGYSVPTRYGKTGISPNCFKRAVHLLGGRPDVQRRLASVMPVMSVDCNRFTLDASYGDYVDGETFRPHPRGGYEQCIRDSIKNINLLWKGYSQQRDDRR